MGRDAGLALRLVVGGENRISDEEADDGHCGDRTDEQRKFGTLAQPLRLVLVVVVDRVERSSGRALASPTARQDRGGFVVDASGVPWREGDGRQGLIGGGSSSWMGAARDAGEDPPFVHASSRYSGFG